MRSSGANLNRILLVGHDTQLAETIREQLANEGFCVSHCSDGKEACAKILRDLPDLVLLDIALPGMDGFALCREIRPAYKGPILFLTARDEDLDQILALELGADDYVVKPVRPQVLLARIRALLRRSIYTEELKHVSAINLGPLRVDPSRREASMSGEMLELTTIEFDLLWLLVNNTGSVLRRDDIFKALRKREYDGLDRSVDVYISRIRQKLGDDPSAPRYVKTVRGVGYLFAGPEL